MNSDSTSDNNTSSNSSGDRKQRPQHWPSQLFLVRVSVVQPDSAPISCHGKVQDAVTGEAHYFESSGELTQELLQMALRKQGSHVC